MNEAVVSGTFAVVGTTLGWVLSEAGAGWRGFAERRRVQRGDATARVFDAARTAVAIAEGVRWLVQVDVAKKLHGEGISSNEYTMKVVELAEHLQQLRLIPLAVTAKGPRTVLAEIDDLVAMTQALWDNFGATTRADIAQRPAPLLKACDQVAKSARELVAGP